VKGHIFYSTLKMKAEQKATQISTENAIDLIRTYRNTIVKSFLNDESIKRFFIERYNCQVSNVKIEFLKRELKELLISPVDLMSESDSLVVLKPMRQ
jgi:hypothetical protein